MRVNLTHLKQAMIGQLDKNNVVANNLANINTMGFKKDLLFFDHLNDELKNRESEHQSTDFAQGTLKQTANPLDLAISGRGFFSVETESGTAYTRQGHFKLDDDGILRDTANRPVLGENGAITLIGKDIKPQNITVTAHGEIYVDDNFIDRLQIVDFENSSDLQKSGNNLFIAKDEAEPLEVNEAAIHQGFLEESNVNPADEMIQLIEVQRQFESMQRMVRSLDEVFRKAATQVGKY